MAPRLQRGNRRRLASPKVKAKNLKALLHEVVSHRARATVIVFQKQKKVSMRQGSNGRRARGRPNRRQGGGINKNSNFDSNGPEGRVRGNAHQVYEKYINLARDATSSGDRILAESFYQFAEHYYRIANDSMDPHPARRRQDGDDSSYDGEDDGDSYEGDQSEQQAEGGQQRPSRHERMNGRPRRPRYEGNGEGRESGQQQGNQSEEQPQPSLDLSKAEQPEIVEQAATETKEAPKPRRRGRPRKEESSSQDDSGSDPAAA